jgi:hypothetical protein
MLKGPDFDNAPKEIKLLALSGVPSRYWYIDRSQLSPVTFKFSRQYGEPVKVPAIEQSNWINELGKSPDFLKKPRIIGIGAEPTDDVAMGLAAYICKIALSFNLKVEMIDLAREFDPQELEVQKPNVVVLHNILAECGWDRIQRARDWLRWADGVVRILVVAGSEPLSFFESRLRMPINSAFFFKGQLRKVSKI